MYFWEFCQKVHKLAHIGRFSVENDILRGAVIVLFNIGIANGNLSESGRHIHVTRTIWESRSHGNKERM